VNRIVFQGPHGSGRRLLEIIPQGGQLADHLQGLVKRWSFREGGGEERPEAVCGKALCALHCLPYACATSAEVCPFGGGGSCLVM